MKYLILLSVTLFSLLLYEQYRIEELESESDKQNSLIITLKKQCSDFYKELHSIKAERDDAKSRLNNFNLKEELVKAKESEVRAIKQRDIIGNLLFSLDGQKLWREFRDKYDEP